MDISPHTDDSIAGTTLFAGGTQLPEAVGAISATVGDGGNDGNDGQSLVEGKDKSNRPDRASSETGGNHQEGSADMVTGGTSGNQDSNGQILATGAPIQSIVLADGKEWKLKPLNLNMLTEIEDKFGKFRAVDVNSPSMKLLRYLLYIRLKPYDTTLTEEQVGELVDAGVLSKLKGILEV